MLIEVAYINRNGSHTLETISGDKLRELLISLQKKRKPTTAWVHGDRNAEVGWVWKNTEINRWVWSMDTDVETK